MSAMIIKQNPSTLRPPRVGERPRAALPEFRNLGVMLRILLLTNAMGFAAALVRASTPADIAPAGVEIAGLLEPLLLMQVLVLVALDPWLRRLPYAWGCAAVLLSTGAIVALAQTIDQRVLHLAQVAWWRAAALSLLVSATVLLYFNYRMRALSPALIAARLQALQARIRPHFLFNSINAVLSLIRAEPRRAEAALEDMADLFRVLMADNRDLAPLENEVELCRQYLALEQLRLGERLQIEWHVDNMPKDALMPPLVLQPLLENAVYHGIEPSIDPGVVSVNIYLVRDQVHMVLRNPYRKDGSHHAGNKMALGNIRERLALHFDAEASLQARVGESEYEVHITIPYVTEDE